MKGSLFVLNDSFILAFVYGIGVLWSISVVVGLICGTALNIEPTISIHTLDGCYHYLVNLLNTFISKDFTPYMHPLFIALSIP